MFSLKKQIKKQLNNLKSDNEVKLEKELDNVKTRYMELQDDYKKLQKENKSLEYWLELYGDGYDKLTKQGIYAENQEDDDEYEDALEGGRIGAPCKAQQLRNKKMSGSSLIGGRVGRPCAGYEKKKSVKKPVSNYIQFLKNYQAKKGITYKEAIQQVKERGLWEKYKNN